MPEPLLEYIHGSYERGATCLQSGSESSMLICCKQGVKQGDPLSCFIFNAVIDWVLTSIKPKIGFQYMDHLLSYLAFADDLVLFASKKAGLQRQIDLVIEAMAKCGLQLNLTECAMLGIDTRCKKAITETKNIAKINGIAVPAIQPGE